MCNKLLDATPIPEIGTGWKLFRNFYGRISSLVEGQKYSEDEQGMIRWNDSLADPGDCGFCFFLDRKEARRASKMLTWSDVFGYTDVILPIRYEGGIGAREEHNFAPGECISVALCKAFKILEE